MTRLQRIFSGARKVLVVFDSCGCPDRRESGERLEAIVSAGADIVELGVPFSDPTADGPVIQRASQIALKQGTTLPRVLEAAVRLRRGHPETGIVLFGYFNVFLQYGLEKLVSEMARSDLDGLLVVDLPYEERGELAALCKARHVALIPLVAPDTTPERARLITEQADGFVYCVTSRGVTGTRTAMPPELAGRLGVLRRISPVPVAAGFGIDGPESAAAVARYADAVVVGSAAVRLPLARLGAFVASLRRALSSASGAAD